jgi:hypothetical protein
MNQRFLTAALVSLSLGAWLGSAKVANADHSLADALADSPTISQAVAQIQSFNKVVCDTSGSNQSYYFPAEEGKSGTAWKQISLCYKNKAAMEQAQKYFKAGGTLGFYGAPGIVGILVVSYTWENYRAVKLISITYL